MLQNKMFRCIPLLCVFKVCSVIKMANKLCECTYFLTFINLQKEKRVIIMNQKKVTLRGELALLIVILINRGLKEYGGDMAIGAYGIVNRIIFLFVMIIMGFNQGMQPIAGYNFGARLYPRVTEVTKLTMKWAIGVATTGFLLCQLFPTLIVNMFTTDDELVKAAVFGLHIVFAVFPIVGFQMVATNFFLSIGMSKKAIFLSLTRQLLFLIPCLIILPRFFGTLGVWISMPVADTIATVVTAIVLVNQFRKFKHVPN